MKTTHQHIRQSCALTARARRDGRWKLVGAHRYRRRSAVTRASVRGQLLQLATDAPALNRIVWGPRCYLVPASSTRYWSARLLKMRDSTSHHCRRSARSPRLRVRSGAAAVAGDVRRRARGSAPGDGGRDADHRPVGENAGLVYATGHYRNGVLLAPLTARAVADLILDNREDPLLAAAAPQRFGEY